jgi:dTDP-4-dehydrorhamnose 3,5-epimerase
MVIKEMNPIIEKTKIEGCYIIKPHIFKDDRGHFTVPFNKNFYNDLLPDIDFIQDNQSYSTYGVIRGIHFQRYPYEQSKLVRCSYGKVRDVVVDLRIESTTYLQHIEVDLSSENGVMIFIPKGCGHGFSVLSNEAVFEYKVDEPYNKNAENGIVWNDKTLNIDWGIDDDKIIVSEKDKELPLLLKY